MTTTIDLDDLGDYEDVRNCNGCGEAYRFVVGEDDGYCDDCLKRGRPSSDDEARWKAAIAKSAERRARARAAARGRS